MCSYQVSEFHSYGTFKQDVCICCAGGTTGAARGKRTCSANRSCIGHQLLSNQKGFREIDSQYYLVVCFF